MIKTTSTRISSFAFGPNGEETTTIDPSESHLLDAERDNILRSLQHKLSGSSLASLKTVSHRRAYDFKWAFTAVIMLLGVAASATVFLVGIPGVHHDSEEAFMREASQLASVMAFSWKSYETLGLWIHESCHYNTNDDTPPTTITLSYLGGFCSRSKFSHIYEHIQSTGIEFIAMQYIPNITHSLRAQLEQESRQFMLQHTPDFEYQGIRDYKAFPNATFKSLDPSPQRPFYFPIHYLEPLDRNEAALDIDMYTLRRDEIDTAMTTLKPVLGPRGVLLQDNTSGVYGVDFIHPGYPTNLEGDQNIFQAISKIVVRIPTLIEQAAAASKSTPASVFIFDETPKRVALNHGQPVFLAAVDILPANDTGSIQTRLRPEIQWDQVPSAKHRFETTIQPADHTWRIIVLGEEPTYNIFFVALGGCFIFVGSLVLALALHTNLHRLADMHRLQTKAEAEKAELALLQAKREMHLNDFIAHEVRNPLSSAIAALSFVFATTQDRVKDHEVRKALLDDIQILDSSLQYINDLLRNMLDIHRSASNKMKLDENATDILKDIFEPVKSILCVKQNKANVYIECPQNLVVNIDRLRVKQIILNLAINATKFVQEGGFIRLRAETIEESVHLFVEDSGPGIRPEQRDRLFDKFQESFDLLTQGTGIGLHICKSLTDLMGANLYLDECYHSGFTPDCPGARFVVDLHRPPEKVVIECQGNDCDLEEGLPAHANSLGYLPERLSVLFVDDDFILRKLFKRTLKRAAPNWKVEEASNGETALALSEENTYDLIFMDMYMASVEKQMLGSATVRALRQKGVTSTICGLSANDLKDHFMECGADAFMLKPFPCDAEKLQRELKRLLQARRQREDAEDPIANTV